EVLGLVEILSVWCAEIRPAERLKGTPDALIVNFGIQLRIFEKEVRLCPLRNRLPRSLRTQQHSDPRGDLFPCGHRIAMGWGAYHAPRRGTLAGHRAITVTGNLTRFVWRRFQSPAS